MIWTPDQFRERHNKQLTPAGAKKASSIANAMIRRGVPEGEAIATANKRAASQKRKPRRK